MNPKENILEILVHFNVVAKVQSKDYEISLEDAKKIDPNAKIGGVVTIQESLDNFNRIGAFNIKNIFHLRLKQLESQILFDEFKDKKGKIVTAQVLYSKGNKDVYVSLGKAEGILPKNEQIPKEKYAPGKHIKAVIKDIVTKPEPAKKDLVTLIILSRSSPLFIKALLEEEIPEIQDGIVEILNIVREPGVQTKVLIKSNRKDVDPVGACLGNQGVRIKSILKELQHEKINIIAYSENPTKMIMQALTSEKSRKDPREIKKDSLHITEVHVDENKKEALVIVPDKEVNKAIGQNGRNVKLASQLLGYKINIKSESEYQQEMSSPEARAKLEALFRVNSQEQVEEIEYEEETPLSELPGLTRRVIELLESANIKSVEQLYNLLYGDNDTPAPEVLEKIPGINKNMAEYIIKIVKENVEIEEEEE